VSDVFGFVHYEFIPEGHTVSKEMLIKLHCRLRDAVKRKYSEKLAQNS
jgi:hypothetical protein